MRPSVRTIPRTAWRERPLGRFEYLVLDARYEKVRHGGSVLRLCGAGRHRNPRPGRQAHRAGLLGLALRGRGALARVPRLAQEARPGAAEVITSDDHEGLKAALAPVFPGLPWQRCQFHLQQNAQAYVPNVALRPQVARDLRSVFNTSERGEADERLAKLVEKYRRPAPKLAEWMEANVPQGLAFFAVPEPHRRRLRTTNALERSTASSIGARASPRCFPTRTRSSASSRRWQRDQRGVGDRTDLPEPGERVRTPAQPALQKKSCFIYASRCAATRPVTSRLDGR